jgi:hypothetical protein
MSKALRCDRCKTCFDPYSQEKHFATIKDFMLQNGDSFNRYECSYRDEELNLCPKCTKLFCKFMKLDLQDESENPSDPEELKKDKEDFDLIAEVAARLKKSIFNNRTGGV